MRGDSIRDLYAKTLALLGLGVLAGTGALVDYWPSGVRLPMVESTFDQPHLKLALAVPENAFEPEISAAVLPSLIPTRVLKTPVVTLAAFVAEAPELESIHPLAADIQLATLSGSATVLVPVTFDARPEGGSASLGEEVSLSAPPDTWIEAPLTMSSAPVALSAVDDHGMISGVVKATKSSLVLTGRKTGASIVGAFRVVSDAVKKAMPN